MLLLAVDTSGKNGSLALVRAAQDSFQVLELVPLAGRMYSAQLIPSLEEALARQNLNKTDIDAFVVASGPGSFTGLRVGISTVKALSDVLHKPIAAVSVLEAAARVANVDGHVIVALDAGRKQVFIGDYDFSNGERQEVLVTSEDFFHSVHHAQARLFSPDAPVREAAAAHGLILEAAPAPQADEFAIIGYKKLMAGESDAAESLEANYIRASDAELFSLPKLVP
jgi:tRNA threonylcarbamoyladenosine biosynthesis protein TsaB